MHGDNGRLSCRGIYPTARENRRNAEYTRPNRMVRQDARLMRKTSVVVVDDHQVVCAGLRSMINAQPDLGVVGEATSGKEALEQLK